MCIGKIWRPGYILQSESTELARVRCELAEARWQLAYLTRFGRIPGGRRFHARLVPWIGDPLTSER